MQFIDGEYAGRTVDRYAILGLIDSGAQGQVYQGRDEARRRDVAIKVFPRPPAAPAGTPAEARALSRLSHPHIAGIYDLLHLDERDLLVMEFVPGATLRDLLARGALPVPDALRLGSQLAQGLAAAHDARVVHCDIKPSNLKVTTAGTLKILDFGVAAVIPGDGDDEEPTLCSAGSSIVGTLPYMAPELLGGRRADPRSDIFSAGAVLYEMVTGVRAFPQRGLASLVESLQHGSPVRPSVLNPEVPPELDRITARAMSKRPSDRYQRAGELAAALDELLRRSTSAVLPR